MERKNGVLLHVSSLPSEYGIGDLGNEAYQWVDLLSESSVSIWQLLPMGPCGPGNSPYQAYSAFAGDPLYISPDKLTEWNFIEKSDLSPLPLFNKKKIGFDEASDWKEKVFRKAWSRFQQTDQTFKDEFKAFKIEHHWWLADYSLYTACKVFYNGKTWIEWDKNLTKRTPDALEQTEKNLSGETEYHKFIQFLFYRQWFLLKNYANSKGVTLFGDVPLYVSHDSADVWGNQELFRLLPDGKPEFMGGVPPDYFCEDGQLWGNPVFNWDKLKATGYQWWIARMHHNLHLYNYIRIDHFRGMESFWSIPAGSATARKGEWVPAYGYEMLSLLKNQIENLPVIAEDLGIITPEVEKLRDAFQLPGMKVLQFAFTSDETNEHLPHNYKGRNVAYTGTHDNDTLAGWWNSIPAREKSRAEKYLSVYKGDVVSRIVEMVWASTAEWAIIPMQDLLKMDSHARMNIPGTATGNWNWRLQKREISKTAFRFIKALNKLYNR